jgi:hypothetical protein
VGQALMTIPAVVLVFLAAAWCWPAPVGLTPEAALSAWFGPDLPLRVKAFKALDVGSPDRVRYRVVVSGEPGEPLPYGWQSGDNIRRVTLQRYPSGWFIADIESVPRPAVDAAGLPAPSLAGLASPPSDVCCSV